MSRRFFNAKTQRPLRLAKRLLVNLHQLGDVTIPNRNYILFRSELFLYEQTNDQIDQWFVGGDCAGWIYARLLPLPNLVRETEPLMEDWGWYASVKTRDIDTSVSLLFYAWDFLDHTWMIGLESKRRFLKQQPQNMIRASIDSVADGIDAIIDSDDRLESIGWYEENPFDTGITDPRK